MNNKQKKILKRALREYGQEKQLDMTMEECSELIDSICKLRRERVTKVNVVNEAADVYIMVQQIALLYGMELFLDALNYKMKRLEERLDHIDALKRQAAKLKASADAAGMEKVNP